MSRITDFYQNCAVVYSPSTLQAYRKTALCLGQVYLFNGATARVHWLQGEYAYLAVNGAVSLLRRLGIKCDLLMDQYLTKETLNEYTYLFIPNAAKLFNGTEALLQCWLKAKDKRLIVSGNTSLSNSLLGLYKRQPKIAKNTYYIKWASEILQTKKIIFSPCGYTINIISAQPDTFCLGKFYQEASFSVNQDDEGVAGSPALAVTDRTIYINYPFFEYIGALLQGHRNIENLRPLLGNDDFVYIDKLAKHLKDLLLHCGCPRIKDLILNPWGEHRNVFALRHDTDNSTDTQYLNFETNNNMPATYAILPDKTGRFWNEQLRKNQQLSEGAYHFLSNKEGWISLVKASYSPDKKAITGRGLFRQTLQASKKYALDFATLQRHGRYFYYPETLDAMGYLYRKMPQITGMGTMFRFTNLLYSQNGQDNSYTVKEPNVSIPFWFPFKMAICSLEQHQPLRGWDSPHLMEPTPSITDIIFASAEDLAGGVYTFGFHPHAVNKRLTGNLHTGFDCFIYALRKAQEKNWCFSNCKILYSALNKWERIKVRLERGNISIYNSGLEQIEDISFSIGYKEDLIQVDKLTPQEVRIL